VVVRGRAKGVLGERETAGGGRIKSGGGGVKTVASYVVKSEDGGVVKRARA
jgi:hypothetical protein